MHLPLILKPNGKGKLSKRDGDKDGFPVFPLEWGEDTPGFREMGFLPEGLVNYLALLGWNDGSEKELLSLTELEAAFSVEGVQKAGARFDYEKAKSVNHQYLSKADAGTLLVMQKAQEVLNDFEEEKQLQIIKLFKERLYTINDLEEEIAFLRNPHPYDEKSVAKIQNKNPLMVLRQIALLLENQKEGETIKNDLFQWAKDNDVPLGLVMQSFRLSLVGKLTGPDLFEICTLLGKNVSLKRVQNFIQYLS